jgi:hypothetical protein
MNAGEAAALGEQLATLVQAGHVGTACERLAPILAERTTFSTLRRIGAAIGTGPLEPVAEFLEQIALGRTMGGWVVISSALEQQLGRDLVGALARCREYIVAADVWYAADTLGEGVPGHALVAAFQPALDQLAPWREDMDAWVRRVVGTAVHFWAKRSRGAVEHTARVQVLLSFLEPMFEERDTVAIKGVGWGLKTLGKHYPDLVTDWLVQQMVDRQRAPRALMVRKALTYLPDPQRARVAGALAR